MSHTPEKWRAMDDLEIRDESSNCIASVWDDEGRDKANARLIAAAPELLHAVYAAHGTFARQLDPNGYGPDWWGDDEHEAYRVLKAALAKAEGK